MLFYDNLPEFIVNEREKLERLTMANLPEVGVVVEVLAPSNNQDSTSDPGYLITQPVDRLSIDCDGVDGDRHRGLTRPATGREGPLYKNSAVRIANRRQMFAVSPADCDELSRRLGVEVTPRLLGANLVIGREDGADYSLSAIPLNTYLAIAPADALTQPRPPIATLVHFLRQKGCSRTGRAIAGAHGDSSLIQRFVINSKEHRGILCSVEYPVDTPAILERGQKVFFKFPLGCCD